MKYVLVHWTESNETSILSEEFVKDKSMLKNPDKEGMVMFGDAKMKAPKNGWNSYLAKVLAASDSKKELMKRELEFFESVQFGVDNDSCDSDDATAKRLRLEVTSTGNKKQDYNRKKNKDVKKKAERQAYKKVIRRIATDDSEESDKEDDDKHYADKLPDEVANAPTGYSFKLEEEIMKIQSEVSRLHQRLPGLVKDAVFAALAKTDKRFPAPCNLKTPSKSQPSTPLRSCSPLTISSSSSEEQLVQKAGSSSPKLMDFIDSVQMSEVMRSPNFKKMTVNLMTALFERSVLAESSVTGKSKEGRPALNRTKVELIIDFVIKKFPQSNDSLIKATMAQKCKDMRVSMDIRRKKQEETNNK